MSAHQREIPFNYERNGKGEGCMHKCCGYIIVAGDWGVRRVYIVSPSTSGLQQYRGAWHKTNAVNREKISK